MTEKEATEEHHLNYERQGDETKVEVVTSAATVLSEKVKELFRTDGRLAQMVESVEHVLEKARGLKSDGYEDPTEDHSPARIAISGSNHGAPHSNWILCGLLLIGIIALVITIERGTRNDERVRNIARDNIRQDAELSRYNERLDRLEQQRRDAQFND